MGVYWQKGYIELKKDFKQIKYSNYREIRYGLWNRDCIEWKSRINIIMDLRYIVVIYRLKLIIKDFF